jgi:hypothetical protein
MNMDVSIFPPTFPDHFKAYAEVDAWRGRCVRHYAKVEQAIARFLADHDVKAQVGGHGLGCRLKQLAAFLKKAPTKNGALCNAVRALDTAKARRESIVHGDGAIYISKDGDWLWDCAYRNAKEQAPTNEIFRKDEAQAFERQLKAQVQGLCDRLSRYQAA